MYCDLKYASRSCLFTWPFPRICAHRLQGPSSWPMAQEKALFAGLIVRAYMHKPQISNAARMRLFNLRQSAAEGHLIRGAGVLRSISMAREAWFKTRCCRVSRYDPRGFEIDMISNRRWTFILSLAPLTTVCRLCSKPCPTQQRQILASPSGMLKITKHRYGS